MTAPLPHALDRANGQRGDPERLIFELAVRGPQRESARSLGSLSFVGTFTDMKRIILGLAIAFSPTFPVLTGNELLDACTSASPFSRGQCMGYIEALLDDYTRYQEEPLTTFCVPAGATLGQTIDLVVKSLRDSPELRDLAASDLIGVALHKAWPCR